MQVLDALHRLRERLGRSLHPGRSAIRVLELIDALTPAQRAKILRAMLADTAVFPPPADVCLTIMRSLQASKRAEVLDALLSDPISVATPHGPIRFIAHSRRGCLRGQKILKKEPDSLKWIDAMAPDLVFWDIGANVGVLTLYAATRGDLHGPRTTSLAAGLFEIMSDTGPRERESHPPVRCYPRDPRGGNWQSA